jgi:hypothetical protein
MHEPREHHRYCFVLACTRLGAFRSYSQYLPASAKHKGPCSAAHCDHAAQGASGAGVAITGTAKYLRKAKAARIVAECGAGKTYMALGAIHVLADGRPSTTLVMCPSHITHKWAREVLVTIPRARAFLIEDLRNGGDPRKAHGVCEVKLRKGRLSMRECVCLCPICGG